jgi:hypothetical protein
MNDGMFANATFFAPNTERQINLTLSLAFLAPQLVKAAVEGRLPRGITLALCQLLGASD